MSSIDRALIARVIEREMSSHPEIRGKKARLAHRADITRTTLDSALNPEKWARTSSSTYRSIEIGLDLPPDALSFVGLHDWQSLEEDGVRRELLAWMVRESSKMSGSPADQSGAI